MKICGELDAVGGDATEHGAAAAASVAAAKEGKGIGRGRIKASHKNNVDLFATWSPLIANVDLFDKIPN